jgi:hypothetical protein
MLATDKLKLAFPGPGTPAFGDGPPLRRTLAAVRAPGQAVEALAVAARVCRTIGGVLRPPGHLTHKYGPVRQAFTAEFGRRNITNPRRRRSCASLR